MEKPQIPTTKEPTESDKFYFRLMYHEFFFGPFDTEDDVSQALVKLDAWDPMWDYDCFCIMHGESPLPKDFVFGFPFVSDEVRHRIEKQRTKYINKTFNMET